MPSATNNLFPPEMAKNSPIETRTSRMAYCSQLLLPSSANWTNRFQSIFYLSKRIVARLCVHPLDPLSAKCGSHERVRKVLGLPCDLVARELHNAHCVRRLAVIGQNQFCDPKITAANDSPDSKTLLARLTGALALYVASAAR